MNNIEFLAIINHTPEDLELAGIDVDELRAIYEEHESRQVELSDLGETIRRSISRFPNVHSTRVRIKSSRSLVRKIIRKRTGDPQNDVAPKVIGAANYRKEIRDLIGLRALHLFKEEWKPIHDAIFDKWKLHPKELPLAYIRAGDDQSLRDAWEKEGFEVKEKDAGYRSLHFVIQNNFEKTPCPVEIQVRTLFEEAWSEIDHTIRYPDHQDDKLLSDYLLILNRLAGGADEMASLLLRFKLAFETLKLNNQQLLSEKAAKDAKIRDLKKKNSDYIEKLDISEEIKNQLIQQNRELAETYNQPPVTLSGIEKLLSPNFRFSPGTEEDNERWIEQMKELGITNPTSLLIQVFNPFGSR